MRHMSVPEPSLAGEAGCEATGHVIACGNMSYSLPWPHACMGRYPIYRIPTVAPGPNSGEVTNPQVRPLYRCPA
jgi:hypothetical protein